MAEVGAVFVSVVPSMKGFSQKVKAEVKSIGDVNLAVDPQFDGRKLKKQVQTATEAAQGTVQLDADISDVQAKVKQAEKTLDALKAKVAQDTPQLRLDIREAEAKANKLRSDLQRLQQMDASPEVDVKIASAQANLGRVERKLAELNGKVATPEVHAQTAAAQAELSVLDRRLTQLQRQRVEVNVDADTGGAVAKLASFGQAARALVPDVEMNVDVDTAAASAKLISFSTLAKATSIGTLGIPAAVMALGSLTSAVAPAVGALALLPAAAGGAAAAFGALRLGFSGFGTAIKEVSAAQESAGESAAAAGEAAKQSASQIASAQERVQDAYRNMNSVRQNVDDAAVRSARTVQRARESLAQATVQAAQRESDARRAAARSIAQAEQQAAAASRQLRSATQDLARAQKDLNNAWEDGRRTLEDLQDRVDDNALDQRQAAYDLADARKALDEARASGDADAIGRAQLAYDRQLETIDQLNKQTQRLGSDNAKAQSQGVAGSQAWAAATDRIASAQERVANAARAAGEADFALNQAREDGARSIARAQTEGARQVANAQRALQDAVQSQQSQQRQGQEQISAAQRQIVSAQKALTEAMADTGVTGAGGVDKAAAAMAALAPNARAAAQAVLALAPAWDAMKLDVQQALWDGLASRITTLGNTYIPILRGRLTELAGYLNGGFKASLDVFNQPMNAAGINTALGEINTGFRNMLASQGPLTQAFVDTFNVGASYFPRLGDAIGAAGQRFATFLSDAAASGQMDVWIENAITVFKQWAELLGNLGSLIGNVFSIATEAGAGFLPTAIQVTDAMLAWVQSAEGTQILTTIFTGVREIFAALAPVLTTVLQALLPVVAALVTALAPVIQALAPLITTLAEVLGTTLITVIQALAPPLLQVVTVLVEALQPVLPVLGQFIGALAEVIGQILLAAIQAIAPVLPLIAQAITAILQAVMPLLPELGTLIGQFIEGLAPILPILAGLLVQVVEALLPVLPPIMRLITALLPPFTALLTALMPVIQTVADILADVLATVLRTIVIPILERAAWVVENILAPILTWLIDNIVRPVFEAIGAVISWVWERVIKPAFDALGATTTWVWERLVKPAFDAMQKGFEKLGDAVDWVWIHVLKPIFDAIGGLWEGIGGAFDWAANALGFANGGIAVEHRATGGVVGYAGGGVLPGYRPGRDTIPAMLSPGEAVLVPELVRVLGARNIEEANAWAMRRSGRAGGGSTGGYASGGVVRRGRVGSSTATTAGAVSPSATMSPEVQEALAAATEAVTEALVGQDAASLSLNTAAAVLTDQQTTQTTLTGALTGQTIALTGQTGSLTAAVAGTTPHVNTLTAAENTNTDAVRLLGYTFTQFQNTVLVPFQGYLQSQMFPTLHELARLISVVEVKAIQTLMSWMPPLRNEMNSTANFMLSEWSRITSFTNESVRYSLDRFDNLKTGMAQVRDAMTHTADWARIKFGDIRGYAADPIRWVLQQPFNAGLISAWNHLNGQFSLNKHVGAVAIPFAQGGVHEQHRAQIAAGAGPVRVWAEPETGGEAYIPLAKQKRGRSTAILNEVASRFGYSLAPEHYADGRHVVQFADGGLWRRMAGVAQNLIPGTRMTSAYRPGDSGYHGRGKAVDLAGPRPMDTAHMGKINRTLAQKFPHSTQLIYTPGINLFRGRPHTYNASTRAQHYDHVHWALENEAMLNGAAGVYAGDGGGFFDPGPIVDEAFRKTYDLIGEIPRRFGANIAGHHGGGIARQAADQVKAKAREKIMEAVSFVDPGGAGVERWRPMVLQALARVGQPAAHANITLRRMNQESGGNPRAINNWDVNARRGTPSKGLMQVIDPTFRAYRDPGLVNDVWDPLANTVASMRYALRRYGSLPSAYNRAGGYDQGGIADGAGLLLKQTIKPERVLSPRQTTAFEGLVPLLQQMTRRDFGRLSDRDLDPAAGGTGGPQYVINQQLPAGADPREFATQMAFAVRRQRMSPGVHSR